MDASKYGKKFFVISGPSGVGKGTIVKELLKQRSDLELSISYTTRLPREGEKDGVDYYFVSREKFLEMKEKNCFLESAEVHGNWYGTAFDKLEEILCKGKHVLFEVDVQGGLTLKRLKPEVVSIFILPPTLEELKRRIEKRGSETPETLARRWETMQKELPKADLYDYKIVNTDLEQTVQEISKIIDKEGKEK